MEKFPIYLYIYFPTKSSKICPYINSLSDIFAQIYWQVRLECYCMEHFFNFVQKLFLKNIAVKHSLSGNLEQQYSQMRLEWDFTRTFFKFQIFDKENY